jgi:hypothetical protein
MDSYMDQYRTEPERLTATSKLRSSIIHPPSSTIISGCLS